MRTYKNTDIQLYKVPGKSHTLIESDTDEQNTNIYIAGQRDSRGRFDQNKPTSRDNQDPTLSSRQARIVS